MNEIVALSLIAKVKILAIGPRLFIGKVAQPVYSQRLLRLGAHHVAQDVCARKHVLGL